MFFAAAEGCGEDVEYVSAIGSRISLSERTHWLSRSFYDAVSDIIELKEVTRLHNNLQHLNTSRLQHSVNVSYYSFLAALVLGANARAAARAGLLHDLYYYDYKDAGLSVREHSARHSEMALQNAKTITNVSVIEEDAIVSHMWPITKGNPKYIEGIIVTFADKYCTILEVTSKVLQKLIR